MQDFRKLKAWHAAHELSLMVIAVMDDRAAQRVPGLRAQAIRAATSVPANLAEGCSRSTSKEFLAFIEIAIGSLNELDAHLVLARDSAACNGDRYAEANARLIVLRRMLLALRRTVQTRLAHEESAKRATR